VAFTWFPRTDYLGKQLGSARFSQLSQHVGSDEGEQAGAGIQQLRFTGEAVDADTEALVRTGSPLSLEAAIF